MRWMSSGSLKFHVPSIFFLLYSFCFFSSNFFVKNLLQQFWRNFIFHIYVRFSSWWFIGRDLLFFLFRFWFSKIMKIWLFLSTWLWLRLRRCCNYFSCCNTSWSRFLIFIKQSIVFIYLVFLHYAMFRWYLSLLLSLLKCLGINSLWFSTFKEELSCLLFIFSFNKLIFFFLLLIL